MTTKPFSAAWELTRKCNGLCIYCGSNARERLEDELTLEDSISLIDKFSKLGIKVINVLGGEIFLRKDWFTILKRIKDKGMDIFLITNGTLLNQEIVNKLKIIDPLNISISLDGNEKYHNGVRKGAKFDIVLKNIDLLLEKGFKVSVITTIIKQNYSFNSLEELYKIICSRKLFSWRIQVGYFEGRMKKEFLLKPKQIYNLCSWISKKNKSKFVISVGDSLGYFSKADKKLRLNKWFGCTAGLTHFSISYNGSIKGCLALPDEYIEGNIKKDDLIKIWESKNHFRYNRNFNLDLLKGKCKSCKYNKQCRGGCKAFNSCNGDIFENKYCNLIIENEE